MFSTPRASLRRRSASLLALLALGSMPLLSTVACGGGDQQPPVTPPPPPASTPEPVASAAPVQSASAAPVDTTPATPPPPPAPTSAVATVKTDATWASCHQSYVAKKKDVSKDVAAMADGCKTVTKMKLVGKTLTGKQADQDKPQSFPFDAKANHCYRAFAQASDGIKDLDLVVKDSAGILVGQDSTDDPSPVVQEDGAVCFSKDDKASVVVAVGMGSGTYAVQVWSD